MSKSSGTFCSQIKTQDESVTLSRSQSLILELAHALATSLRYSEGDAITHPLPNAVAQMAGAHILAVKELKSTFLLHLDKQRGGKSLGEHVLFQRRAFGDDQLVWGGSWKPLVWSKSWYCKFRSNLPFFFL